MSRPDPTRRAAKLAARLGFIACLLIAVGMVALPLAGYHRYVITGGSMGDTIERGSVIWAKAVPVADLKVGDVITYTPPPDAGPSGLVTHRIVAAKRQADGRRIFRTKGDANAGVDPWTFELRKPTQARVAFHLPHLGRALALVPALPARTVVVGLLALLIVISTFAGLWRDAGRATQESVA